MPAHGHHAAHSSKNTKKLPSFTTMWNAYPRPSKPDEKHAHPSKGPYENQCAIRVSVALERAGFSLGSYPKDNKTQEGWARSSRELADYLWHTVGRPKIMSQEEFQAHYAKSTGVMYLAPPKGALGHIDLWNQGEADGYYKASEVWFWEAH